MAAENGVRDCYDNGFVDAIPHKTLGGLHMHMRTDIIVMPY